MADSLFEFEIEHFNDGMKISQVNKQRDVYIAYEAKSYMVILLENNEMVATRRIAGSDYELLISIVSDWIEKGK